MGQHARSLLNDKMVQAIFEESERECVSEWKESADVKAREAAWYKVWALREVQHLLRVIEGRGQMAEHTRDKENKV
jgi:hypothetical protein